MSWFITDCLIFVSGGVVFLLARYFLVKYRVIIAQDVEKKISGQ